MFNIQKIRTLTTALQASEIKAEQCEQVFKAITNNIAFIEFTPDGTITDANTLFQDATGYSLNEIIGQHHRIFCDNSYTSSKEYAEFWKTLQAGKSLRGTVEVSLLLQTKFVLLPHALQHQPLK